MAAIATVTVMGCRGCRGCYWVRSWGCLWKAIARMRWIDVEELVYY